MLDETALQSLVAALDVAISRCVDAFNISSEAGRAGAGGASPQPGDGTEGVPRRSRLLIPPGGAGGSSAGSPRGDARSR